MNEQDIISRITSGTTTRREEVTVLWKDEHHALVKFASTKYWADVMTGYTTSPMHVELLKLAELSHAYSGKTLMEGKRMSKVRLEALIRAAKLATARKLVLEQAGTGDILRALSACQEELP